MRLRNWSLLRVLGAWLLGLGVGWALRGESVRAAGDWHIVSTTTPGFLFFRYNTSGEIQGCYTTGTEWECKRLPIVER